MDNASEWVSALWDASSASIASQFLLSVKASHMFAILDCSSAAPKLILQLGIPRSFDALAYFVRDPTAFVTKENINKAVLFGTLRGGDSLHSLLQTMQGLYVPAVLGNSSWPETVRADFTAQLHKFMATLTETVYEARGKTILYIPQEDLGDAKVSAKQKDLVQRLESTIIHWTRQIKEVVNQQDSQDASEHSGPLSEIEYWRERSVDLSGIRNQLDDPNVAQIVTVLEQAKSSYLAPFLNLRNLIHRWDHGAVPG